ncbi:hypothetical protein OHB33_22125 [Streptomyces sp. NBC_01558]|uniref:hypothetical protein n=1 Tax=Streptomyces sp. NBC_01558 TaxID=2975878 RepID=UPI002DD9BD65|nr:hypothetical protein [Streptomyces sp. NBC_01558]WSD78802.1 hypothetical protein OHB33_22125 [Streptomyces sp. NBC_01558]
MASEYETELSLLRHLLDDAVQKVALRNSEAAKPLNGPAVSALARTELIAASRESLAVRRSRMEIREVGTAWVRVRLDGAPVQPRLRMRPPTAQQANAALFDEETLRGPAGSIVLLWNWDGFASLRSLTLSRVTSMKRWGISCDILEEIQISSMLAGTVESPLSGVPFGSRNEDDDLAGVVSVWDNEEDIRSEQEVSDTRDEDNRDGDEGNSTVGGQA